MTESLQWEGFVPDFGESRFLLRRSKGEQEVCGVDSAALIMPSDKGKVMITASHGARFGNVENKPIPGPPIAVVFNDAGGGADDSGFSRLAVLNGEGVVAATVSAMSARIGDARSTWQTGVISHANDRAQAAGIAVGDDLSSFADKAIAAGECG